MEQPTLILLGCAIACAIIILTFQFRRVKEMGRQLQLSQVHSNDLTRAREGLEAVLKAVRQERDNLQKECENLRDDPPLPNDSKLIQHLSRISKRILKTADKHEFLAIEARVSRSEIAQVAAASMVRLDNPRLVLMNGDWTSDDEEMVIEISVVLRATNRPPFIPYGLYRAKSQIVVQLAGHIERMGQFAYQCTGYEPEYHKLPTEEEFKGAKSSVLVEGSLGTMPRAVPSMTELLAQLQKARARLGDAIEGLAKQRRLSDRADKYTADAAHSEIMEEGWKERIEKRRAELKGLEEFIREVGSQ